MLLENLPCRVPHGAYPVESVDGLGNITVTAYNAAHQPTSVTVGSGTSAAATTTTTYDLAGFVASVTDPDGSGTVQTIYIRGDQQNQLLASVAAGDTVSWYLQDHLESVRGTPMRQGLWCSRSTTTPMETPRLVVLAPLATLACSTVPKRGCTGRRTGYTIRARGDGTARIRWEGRRIATLIGMWGMSRPIAPIPLVCTNGRGAQRRSGVGMGASFQMRGTRWGIADKHGSGMRLSRYTSAGMQYGPANCGGT